MKRITIKMLEDRVAYLNKLTGNPEASWTRVDGRMRANVGNYLLSASYGGYSLVRITNESGGQRDVLNTGHISKRHLMDSMNYYIEGIRDQQEAV